MSSAASKAAKSMGSSKRNRPALAKSQKSTDESAEGGSTPLFMDDVNSQYQSLSERLAKENASSSAPSSGASSTGRKQKVKWAETAALASTLDAAKAADNDEDAPRSSPLETISDLFQKKYTMPVFLLASAGIFLMVHLTGRQDGGSKLYASKVELTHDGQDTVFTSSTSGESPLSALEKERSFPLSGLHKTRSFNIGQGDGFSSVLFSFVPTPSPAGGDVDLTQTGPPTAEVMLHTTPKLTRASIPTPATAGKDGFEAGWILVPTSSNGKGDGLAGGQAGFKEGWGYPPGVPTPDPVLLGLKGNMGLDNGLELAPNKWGFPPGYPTPDPAYLANVSPQTQKWNFPDGVPTPDPIYLPKGDGSKTGLLWGYPPGVPTPNPDLLIEVAPDNTSPTNLKWNIPLGQPTPDPAYLGLIDNESPTTLKWNIPDGKPTPDPALLTEVAPDKNSPTTLKWNIPLGQPTPDPALLGKPVTLGWGYPPGVPTPDPALLQGVPETVTWGYPPGIPTPDPALLGGVVQTMSWGYPPGVPTPNPDLLLGDTQAPSGRTVETGKFDSKDNGKVEIAPSKVTGKEEKVTVMKIPGIPEVPQTLTDEPPQPAQPAEVPDISVVIEQPDVIAPKDSSGNIIEIAPPPAPVPQISVTVKNPPIPQPPPPDVQVVTQPAPGNYGWFRPFGSTGSRPARPDGPRPARGPGQGGYNIPNQGYMMSGGCGGCGCGCCGCGGGMIGGAMWGNTGVVPAQDGSNNFVVPQFMMPGGVSADPRSGLTGLGIQGLPQPQCPWDCIIDETVPTKGRSNEDDAIYEIFYTNPLNCCGTIVEIGAGNGEQDSPSYFFEYGMNWTAILTEADPINFDAITKTRSGDKAMLLNGAFCQEGQAIYFDNDSRFFQTEKSGQYSSEVLSQTPFPITDKTPKVECVRLDTDVLSGVDHVDVMVIRVKGDPWAVVRTMDWDVTVDIWVILMEDRPGMLHDTLRAALKLHDYVPAAWEIKLWCETPENCLQNEVWLRKSFSALPQPLMGMTGGGNSLRGSIA